LSREKTGARRPDQDLHDALTDLRKTRQVPWHGIEDETRSFDDYTGYASVRDGVLAKLPLIRIDPWQLDNKFYRNYLQYSPEVPLDASLRRGRVWHIVVAHDGWCAFFSGAKCNCNPTITKHAEPSRS
jgi:hypothetical protein